MKAHAPPDFEFSPRLDTDMLPQAAALVLQTFRDFYGIFGEDRDALLASIARQLARFSEIDQFVAAGRDQTIAGLISYYSLAEAEHRRLASVKDLLPLASDKRAAVTALRSFSESMAPFEGSALYLSRVSVAEAFQGAGLATRLLGRVEDIARSLRYSQIVLHVEARNDRARAFYARAGFTVVDPRNYILLKKDLAS